MHDYSLSLYDTKEVAYDWTTHQHVQKCRHLPLGVSRDIVAIVESARLLVHDGLPLVSLREKQLITRVSFTQQHHI
jgi:hypothetical protein